MVGNPKPYMICPQHPSMSSCIPVAPEGPHVLGNTLYDPKNLHPFCVHVHSQEGVGCDGGPPEIPVCGMCGVLSETCPSIGVILGLFWDYIGVIFGLYGLGFRVIVHTAFLP